MRNIVIGFATLISFSAVAQTSRTVSTRNLVWAGINAEYKFNPKWSVALEGHYRFEPGDGDIYQWLIRPFATYQTANGWRISAGGAYSSLYPNPNGKTPRPEIRPWQEVGRKWQFGVHHVVFPRIRFEQRFIREYEGSKLVDVFSLSTCRLRLRSDYNFLFHADSGIQEWSAIIGEEVMFIRKSSGFTAFEQNRVWGGIGYKFAANHSVTLLYLHLWQQRKSSVFDQAHVIRVTYQFTFARRKEEPKK